MLTTLDLDESLLVRAEEAAQLRGISVADLVSQAIVRDLDEDRPRINRVQLPIFKSDRPGTLHLTSEMINQLEEEDDLRRSGITLE